MLFIHFYAFARQKPSQGRKDGQSGIITKSASFQVDEYSLSGPMYLYFVPYGFYCFKISPRRWARSCGPPGAGFPKPFA